LPLCCGTCLGTFKGTRWQETAGTFGLGSILGDLNTASKPLAKQLTANHQCHLRSHSVQRKMMIIYFKRRVSSFADSLKSLYAMRSCGLQNEINGFLNCLKKSLFFLQNTPPYSNTGQRTTASVPLPLHQTHSDQNLHTQPLQSSPV